MLYSPNKKGQPGRNLFTQSRIELLHLCRELDGVTYAEEVLVTKSELEEKKQRMSELETQASPIYHSSSA